MKISRIDCVNYNLGIRKQEVSKTNIAQNKQMSKLPNLYYSPTFARKWSEHQSWGVRLKEDGTSSAKIFTFPDVEKVELEVNENEKQRLNLQKTEKGVFEGKFAKGTLKEGDRYSFVIKRKGEPEKKVKDPYSFYQPEILGPSVVYNQNRYSWNDDSWQTNPDRISRLANKNNGFIRIEEARIYELNPASLTKKGNFDGVKDELKRIKDTGFNAIEIMPVENTYSYNWGYDGVDKFAVSNFLGGPDKLKELVDAAHNVGLNVIMDMVPNHLGPDGAQLKETGLYLGKDTGWGDSFIYEGEGSRYVRDFMVNAALNWIDNYHCDGLRLDMTKYMKSDTTMQQIAAEVNYHFPDAFLIAEDGRGGKIVRGNKILEETWEPYDQRVIGRLKPNENAQGKSEEIHEKAIEDITNKKIPLARLGYDSEWDFNYYHTLVGAGFGQIDLDRLERAVVDSFRRIKYTSSHDEIGNKDGTRLISKFMAQELELDKYIPLTQEDEDRAKEYADYCKRNNKGDCSLDNAKYVIRCQKAQQLAHKLAQDMQCGDIRERNTSGYNFTMIDYYTFKLGFPYYGTYLHQDKIVNAFDNSVRKYRMLEALKYFTPGPIMTFQGEERLDLTKFNFFREFQSNKDERDLYLEKGYPNGKPAYQESIMGNLRYSERGKATMAEFEALISDLNQYKAQNPSSTIGHIVRENTVKHYQNPTVAFHARDKESGNETFVITNFSNEDYPTYEMPFPNGRWREIINTNSEKYGGDGDFENRGVVDSAKGGKNGVNITLPANSTIIFKKISD